MKTIEKISKLIVKKEALYGLGILLFFAFRAPIESFLNRTFVKYLFGTLETKWYNDITFFLVAMSAILLTVSKFRKYTPSRNLTVIMSTGVIIYSIYRITGIGWEFTPLSLLSRIKYFDILFVFIVCQFLLFIKKNNIRQDETNSFYEDQPVGENGVDELGYTDYAEQLGRKILSSHFNKAFAIGINGKWGLGKTSFIDLIKRNVKGDNILEVDFNPWNSHSPESIIKDFFETVQQIIYPYHSSLSRLLIKYSNKLVTLNRNVVAQTIQTTVAAFTGFDSVIKLYDEINTALIQIDKKIVVYIDDLDRLDKNEIIEVIRLIRNTANFHNTYFIVTYDRNYVINALRQHNPHKQEVFLEKIFQIEVTLPYFNKDILRYKLAEKLKEKLPKSIHFTIDEEVIGTPSSVPEFLNDWLDSMRDVTRLANTLSLNFIKLVGEVDFNDFMRMELLRLKYPSVYELLFRNTPAFLETSSDDRQGKQHFHLIRIDTEQNTATSTAGIDNRTCLEKYLTDYHSELSIPQNDISKIVDFVDGVFGGQLSFLSASKSHLTIVYPSNFYRYFAYNLLESNLSEIEFSKARSLTQDELNTKIAVWVEKGFEFVLKDRFSEIKAFDNRDDFEKTIRAIFFLANQTRKSKDTPSRELIGYDGQDLMEKMNNNNNKIVLRFYPEPEGTEELKTFVRGLFNKAKSPYSFEADFIKLLNLQFSSHFPLSKSELKDIIINYLKIYCSEIETFNPYVWILFHNCEQTEWVSSGGSASREQETTPIEAKEIIKDFILNKDLDGFLFSIIEVGTLDFKKFRISDATLKIFDNWDTFKNELALKNVKTSKYLLEFNSFLAKYALEKYASPVEFSFKSIPIQSIRR